MQNRYINGLWAGIGGGLAATAVNLFLVNLIRFGRIRFIDFSSIFVIGHFPHNIWETIFAFLVNLVFYATSGVVFAYLISFCSERYLLLKGAHYGLGVWFIAYAITILFKIPELENVSLPTALTNFIAALCYGLVAAALLRLLRRKGNGPK